MDSPSTRTRRSAIAVESSLRPLPVNAGTSSIGTETRFSASEDSKVDAEPSSSNERESNLHQITSTHQSPSSTVLSTSTPSRASSDPPDGNKHDGLTSEIDEVDQFLTGGVGSCSLDGVTATVTRTFHSPTPSVADINDVEDPSFFMEVDEDFPINQGGSSPTVTEMGRSFMRSLSSPPRDVEMERPEALDLSEDHSLFSDEGDAVDPDRFYRSPPKKVYGNHKAALVIPEDVSVCPDEDQQQAEPEEEEETVPDSALEKTSVSICPRLSQLCALFLITLDTTGHIFSP